MTSQVEPQIRQRSANPPILTTSLQAYRTRRSCHMIPVTMLRSLSVAVTFLLLSALPGGGADAPKAPVFEVDASWPTIPNNWVLGEVTSISVDSKDHIWV